MSEYVRITDRKIELTDEGVEALMSDYTPTTEEVCDAYRWHDADKTHIANEQEFDRWLAEVKAEAWLEGYGKGFYELRSMPYGNGTLQNPYRGENK